MVLKWLDVLDIAIELDEKYPDTDPLTLNFLELKNMILALDEFDDDPEHSGEKVLEAIQQSWIDEKE
ncbi:MAG: Fe-S assembly protein IscX [Gammaproteobacteria bacterium]|nr:MAG: Fe-S assembly protein IscX [Gammaproteobacteria bacterium]